MKSYIISHDKDLDGHASGQIAYDALSLESGRDIECIGWDYSYNPLDLIGRIEPDSDVYILDLSLPKFHMETLNHLCNLIWIDHHKTAIEEMADMTIGGVREIGVAACELAWKYFFPDKDVPMIIFLLGKYDTWRKEDEEGFTFNDAKAANCALRYRYQKFPDLLFSAVIRHGDRQVIELGRDALRAYRRKNKSMAKDYCHVEYMEGEQNLRVLCINSNERNSGAFEGVYDPLLHDIMCCYFFDGKMWIHSLYSEKEHFDVSRIAKSYGGGGHAGAAGFQLDKPMF